MGPITDDATRKYLTHLLGDVEVQTTTTTAAGSGSVPRSKSISSRHRPAASPRDLQQLGRDRAILVDGTNVPAVVAIKPWWEVPAVQQRAQVDEAAGPTEGSRL